MLSILKAIADKVGAEVGSDAHLEELREETQPEHLVQQIKEHEEG
jgi:hypothetical protein